MLAFRIDTAFFNQARNLSGPAFSPGSLISFLLPNIIVVASIVFFFLILFGGFGLIIGAGKQASPQETAKAKNALTYGVIGFLLVVTAYFILQIINAIFGGGLMAPPTNLWPMFGSIRSPFYSLGIPNYAGSERGSGLFLLLNNLVKFAIILAGLYTFFNLISAGYMFISAGGEPKNISKAWDKIWQSLVGLLVVAASVVIAMLFGYLIFGDSNALIHPVFYGP